MCGVPAEKSCRMMLTTTRTPLPWAAASRFVRSLEFHSLQPVSFVTRVPSLLLTWIQKKATVETRPKCQLG